MPVTDRPGELRLRSGRLSFVTDAAATVFDRPVTEFDSVRQRRRSIVLSVGDEVFRVVPGGPSDRPYDGDAVREPDVLSWLLSFNSNRTAKRRSQANSDEWMAILAPMINAR